MSQYNDRHEAERWLETAADDLRAARALADQGLHAHACFSAEQCAEKAVKAVWYHIGENPWGHSIRKLLEDFPLKDRLEDGDDLLAEARLLDRLYVPTRYPNGLPDLTPEKSYGAADSQQAISFADHFLRSLGRWIETSR
jgi:HEPN domain-containing protein